MMPDSDPQKTVFISYRRDASSFIARAIFSDLRLHGYDIFMDVESIDSGTFDTIILRQIAARAHFLIICTPGTFERCEEPGDWLRREIETAIEQQRNVVPILVNGYKFDEDKKFLTEWLEGVPRLNALTLFHDYFDAGMERLRDRFLKLPFEGDLLPTSKADQPIVKQKIEQIVAQSAPTSQELTAEEYFIRAFTRPEEDLESQIADYSEAIRLNKDYAWAYNNRGWAREKQGDLDGAMSDYNEAIRLDPMNAAARYNRRIARTRHGNLKGTTANVGQTIQIEPKDAAAFANRALGRVRQGDLTGAVADFSEAIRLDQGNSTFFNKRGEAYFALRLYANARADFETALILQPKYKYALAGLPLALNALGYVTTAQASWHALVEADSDYRDADWVGKEFGWRPELIEAARTLIATLDA